MAGINLRVKKRKCLGEGLVVIVRLVAGRRDILEVFGY